MLGAWQQGSDPVAEHRLAADGDRVERSTVKRIPQRQRLVAAGGDARELQRHSDRQGSGRREQDLAERIGRKGGQLRCEFDRGLIRVAPRRERERIELAPDRRHHVRMTIADLVDAVAVEVHHPAAFDVGEPDAVARRERVETGRGQRLMQERIPVGVEQRPRRGVQVLRFERAAQRREVDVALGGDAGGRTRRVHRKCLPAGVTMAASTSWCW